MIGTDGVRRAFRGKLAVVASVAVMASSLAALSGVAHAASPPVTFGAPESFRISGRNPNPLAVTMSDLNGDSIKDVVTGNANPNSVGQEGGGLSILLGNGDGSFAAHSGFGPSAVYSVATSDQRPGRGWRSGSGRGQGLRGHLRLPRPT